MERGESVFQKLGLGWPQTEVDVSVEKPDRILKHGKRDVFIEAPDGATDQETRRKEQEADTFASDFLIPKHALNEFRQQARFTTQTVQRFAAQLGIAPGIVVGRLQHEQLLPFTHLNPLKRRFYFKGQAQ